MKNITVSVDEEIHRLARIRAAERDTSVSALVRDFLRRLATGGADGTAVTESRLDVDELRRRRLREVLVDIRAASAGFKAADNIPRDELYDRNQAPADHPPGDRDADG
ncbi:MAG: hypothetical protein OXH68_19605 [Gammaproteobacteria bacterium]|nr:hypothetical protein [Gammaproteobacteria bacterium]